MVEAILLDSRRILPVCAYVDDAYGIKDLYCGVPAVLGKKGVEKIIELELNAKDLKALQDSAQAVEDLVTSLKLA